MRWVQFCQVSSSVPPPHSCSSLYPCEGIWWRSLWGSCELSVVVLKQALVECLLRICKYRTKAGAGFSWWLLALFPNFWVCGAAVCHIRSSQSKLLTSWPKKWAKTRGSQPLRVCFLVKWDLPSDTPSAIWQELAVNIWAFGVNFRSKS